MVRKLFIVGALAALPLGVLANSALAGPPPIDVSNGKIVCNTVIGTVKIKPALEFGGTAPSTTIQVGGTLDGCTVSNTAMPVIMHASKFKGVLTSTTGNDCANLLAATSVSGTITIGWKADSTTPISLKSSTLTPGALTGGTFAPAALAPGQYGKFTIGGGTSVTGAFTGGDGGSTTTATIITAQDTDALNAACTVPPAKGLKALNIGPGTFSIQ